MLQACITMIPPWLEIILLVAPTQAGDGAGEGMREAEESYEPFTKNGVIRIQHRLPEDLDEED